MPRPYCTGGVVYQPQLACTCVCFDLLIFNIANIITLTSRRQTREYLMMALVTLDDLKQRAQVSDEQLGLQCSDEHLDEIAPDISNWMSYAHCLLLEAWQIQAIKVELNLDYLHKIKEVLKTWKKNSVHKATYYNLAVRCLQVGDGTIAGRVCELAKTVQCTPETLVDWFKKIGLCQKDIDHLIREGFTTRQAFLTLTKDDIPSLKLTIAGGRILSSHVTQEVQDDNKQATPTASNYLRPDTHLRYLYEHTIAACTTWHNIGLQLGVPVHALDTIGRNARLHDDKDYYREMLTSWMNSGSAKCSELLDVLKGPTVAMKDVADSVRSLDDNEKRLIGL